MLQQLEINLLHSHKTKLNDRSSASYILCFVCLFALSTYTNLVLADAKIVKWKDVNGVTHYGDKMPAQDAGRSNSVLSTQGTVIKTNESFNPNTNKQEADRLSAERVRQDSALLASYSSVEEIDFAHARNVKIDQLALQTMRQQLGELTVKSKALTAAYAGKKMPADVLETKKNNQLAMSKLQADISSTELSIAQTKKRYDDYKKRYLELRPREQTLTYIKVSKRSIAELENWKADAQERLDSYLGKDLAYKRSGSEAPQFIKDGIQQASDEVARAEDEIAAAKGNLKKSEQSLTH